MPIIHHAITVPYTPAQMFALVNNIEDYQLFLPYCKSSRILSRTEQEVKATLVLAGAGLQKSFSTRNVLEPDTKIDIKLLDGPFKHLEGCWRFSAQAPGCAISLDLEFEIAGRLLAMAFGPVFNQVANTLVEAFRKRAEVVYGRPALV